MIITPSIAAANQLFLAQEIDKIAMTYKHLHIDIEDGNFIPNITFGMKLVNDICTYTEMEVALHFMTTNPAHWINQLKHCVGTIFVHVENMAYPCEIVNLVKSKGAKVGLAFNPSTMLEPYLYLFAGVDSILIMTSEPDGQGQKFLPGVLHKVTVAKKMNTAVFLDGGITFEQLNSLESQGIDGVVMGRSIFTI